MHQEPSQNEIIDSLKENSENALKQLFEMYHKQLYGYVYQFIKSRQETDDIVQEVFIRVWQNRNTLDATKSLKSYLFIISKNLIIDSFRLYKSTESLKKEMQKRILVSTNNTEDSILFNDLNDFFSSVISKMPKQQKEVFTLSRVNGMTNFKIAHKLNISIHTVDNHIQKSLRMIRRFYLKPGV